MIGNSFFFSLTVIYSLNPCKATTKKASSTTNNNSNKDKDNTIDKNPQTFDNLYLNIVLLLIFGVILLVVINKIKKIKNKLNNM